MRDALRRQHNSLHTAFHRVKSVEGELARAHGAHAEEHLEYTHDVGFTGASGLKYPLRESLLRAVRAMNASGEVRAYTGTWRQTTGAVPVDQRWALPSRTPSSTTWRRPTASACAVWAGLPTASTSSRIVVHHRRRIGSRTHRHGTPWRTVVAAR